MKYLGYCFATAGARSCKPQRWVATLSARSRVAAARKMPSPRFSQGRKRGAAAERDQIDRKADPAPASDTGAEADEADTQTMSSLRQSDDVLSLLEGLFSSASFSDEAGLPAGEGQPAELHAPAEDDALVPEDTADAAVSGLPDAIQPPAEAISAARVDTAETEVSALAGAPMEPGSPTAPASPDAEEAAMPDLDRTAAPACCQLSPDRRHPGRRPGFGCPGSARRSFHGPRTEWRTGAHGAGSAGS